MDDFFVSFPTLSGGGGGEVVTDVNGTSGSVTIAAGSGIAVTDAGQTVTISSTAANRALSNLTSPTAINQSLIFAAGLSGLLETPDDSVNDTLDITVQSGNATGASNGTGGVILASGIAANGDSGSVDIVSGDARSPGATSGDINIAIGPVTSGTLGNLRLRNGSEGTPGSVWTSTDNDGAGSWIAPSNGTVIITTSATIAARIAHVILNDPSSPVSPNTITLPAGVDNMRISFGHADADTAQWNTVASGSDTIGGIASSFGLSPFNNLSQWSLTFLGGTWYSC